METKFVPAIFEDGKLRPLAPLDLHEQERVEVAIVRMEGSISDTVDDYLPLVAADADLSVTLEQVQQALSKIPGALVEDFALERDERF